MALTAGNPAAGPGNPLVRLYETADRLGIAVLDGATDASPWPDERTAAVVSFGEHIALNPGLDDDLRTDVLAMALIVAAVMGDHALGHPCAIAAPGGLVVISRTRVADPGPGPGRLATLLARKCGHDTPSAAFEYAAPEPVTFLRSRGPDAPRSRPAPDEPVPALMVGF